MQISIDKRDEVLKRFGNQLGALGDGKAATVMARALNHEGDKGRTQVKRVLVKQTGIRYGEIDSAVRTIPATPARLAYTIQGRGVETNVAMFGGVQRKSGVSAAPWNIRRIFAHAFLMRGHLRAFIRKGKARLPIRPLFGPNLGRELVKGPSKAAFEAGSAAIADRVGHEIARELEGQ